MEHDHLAGEEGDAHDVPRGGGHDGTKEEVAEEADQMPASTAPGSRGSPERPEDTGMLERHAPVVKLSLEPPLVAPGTGLTVEYTPPATEEADGCDDADAGAFDIATAASSSSVTLDSFQGISSNMPPGHATTVSAGFAAMDVGGAPAVTQSLVGGGVQVQSGSVYGRVSIGDIGSGSSGSGEGAAWQGADIVLRTGTAYMQSVPVLESAAARFDAGDLTLASGAASRFTSDELVECTAAVVPVPAASPHRKAKLSSPATATIRTSAGAVTPTSGRPHKAKLMNRASPRGPRMVAPNMAAALAALACGLVAAVAAEQWNDTDDPFEAEVDTVAVERRYVEHQQCGNITVHMMYVSRHCRVERGRGGFWCPLCAWHASPGCSQRRFQAPHSSLYVRYADGRGDVEAICRSTLCTAKHSTVQPLILWW